MGCELILQFHGLLPADFPERAQFPGSACLARRRALWNGREEAIVTQFHDGPLLK